MNAFTFYLLFIYFYKKIIEKEKMIEAGYL